MKLVALGLLLLGASPAFPQSPVPQSPVSPAQAAAAFTEAQHLSTRDAGHLWGIPLYGPMIFVDPMTHAAVANQADAGGLLKPATGGVFAGTLPDSFPVANTACEWSGTHWTMVLWPLPKDTPARDRLLAHELFHRIQPALHLQVQDAGNPHLDTMQGRLWLQLEWRALAKALLSSGTPQTTAVEDAIAFRQQRAKLFPGSDESERKLELQEGLAEYTGTVAGSSDTPSATWRSVSRLSAPSANESFVRSMAYTSGPAYGLLLDQRAPGWRKHLTDHSDLSQLLAATLPTSLHPQADDRATLYGVADLRISEGEREQRAQATRAKYTALLITGPTLSLPRGEHFNYGFNPNELVPLGDAGTVYPTFKASDDWGTLDVSEGALLTPKSLIIPAPTNPTALEGHGWKLTLSPGWKLFPGSRPGSYTLTHP